MRCRILYIGHRAMNPGPWGRIEYGYSRMARGAGIEMPETHLLRDGEFAHFMTRRFDRAGGDAAETEGRLHFHSLGGLQHIDFNDQFVFSYERYFDTIRAIGLGQSSVNEAWTRQHQMSVNGKFREITRGDLIRVGEMYDVPEDGREIVGEVVETLGRWREHAGEAGVPSEIVGWVEGRMRLG